MVDLIVKNPYLEDDDFSCFWPSYSCSSLFVFLSVTVIAIPYLKSYPQYHHQISHAYSRLADALQGEIRFYSESSCMSK